MTALQRTVSYGSDEDSGVTPEELNDNGEAEGIFPENEPLALVVTVGAAGAATAAVEHADTDVTLEWGDGTAADTLTVTDGSGTGEHTYAANGAYTVTATGGEESATQPAVVADITPSADAS